MTQTKYDQKKRECWEESVLHGALEVDKDLLFDHAFKCGYTLGKQEKDAADTVISGWAARDADGSLYVYRCKPERVRYINGNDGVWMLGTIEKLDSALFPDLTWESEPQEVELIIKRKKNG